MLLLPGRRQQPDLGLGKNSVRKPEHDKGTTRFLHAPSPLHIETSFLTDKQAHVGLFFALEHVWLRYSPHTGSSKGPGCRCSGAPCLPNRQGGSAAARSIPLPGRLLHVGFSSLQWRAQKLCCRPPWGGSTSNPPQVQPLL